MRVFGWPALIFALSLGGLVLALLGDGVWDAIGWAGLSSPALAVLWARFRRA